MGAALEHFFAQPRKVSGVEPHHSRTQVPIDQLSDVGRGGSGTITGMAPVRSGPDQQAITLEEGDLTPIDRPAEGPGQWPGQQIGLKLIDFHANFTWT